MSCNARVSEQVKRVALQYGVNHEAYEAEKEIYWQILEEELEKEPVNGWIGYEDPVDALRAFLEDEDDKEDVAEILGEYIRFCEICKKVTGKDWMDRDLVAEAEEYVRG